MRLTGAWIERPETRAVCAALTKGGHRALFVGGCVRNALLGEPVGDIDIATDAPPDTVVALAEAAGLKPVPTGIAHGTVTVVSGRLPHEVTTFRADVETDGRHAQVAFGQSLEADARRRDFTMNALYAEADGTVIDPLGGLPDLRARHVRFIGDPAERIREDRLRVLRFFRFQARYGDPAQGPDAAGLAACAAASDTLEALSRERVGAEMLKLLAAPDPAPALAAMQAAGVLAATLPGADASAMAVLVHVEALCCAEPDALRRLALLGGAEPADRLRLSKADRRRVETLRGAATGSMPAGELGYRLGHDDGRDAVLIRCALSGNAPSEADLADIARGAAAEFPIAPADLMPDYTGAALGERLRALEARWIASGFSLGRGDLL